MKVNEFKILRNIATKAKFGDRIACPICGTAFVKNDTQRIYCNSICKKRASYMMTQQKAQDNNWKR